MSQHAPDPKRPHGLCFCLPSACLAKEEDIPTGHNRFKSPHWSPFLAPPLAGIAVTGQIIGEKGSNASSRTGKTYFGKLGITNAWMDFRIEVTTEKIILGNGDALSTFSWLDTVTVTQTG